MAAEQPPHLGGFIPGGDEATMYPDLWTWLVREQGVRSVIDVGCGDGQAVNYFAGLDCLRVVGIEGVPQPDNPLIVQHDYTTGPLPPLVGNRFDLAWCCEFVEHVEERYVRNFMPTFLLADLVLITHAFPGQAGYHHVNCREPSYWEGAFAAIGFLLDQDLTDVTRALARSNPSAWNHYVRSGLAFRNERRA